MGRNLGGRENTEDGMQFSRFVNKLREKKNLSMEQLCEGLCSPRMVWYLESGERMPDKLVQDAILERLGIGAEDYEHFLDHKEYRRWEARQHILHSITFERWEQAESLLEEYRGAHDMEDKLEKQFYLSMLVQVRRGKGCGEEELRTFIEEALRLTVPLFGQKPLAELALSVKELNLILEAERCRGEEERPERYQEIAEYTVTNGFDRRSRAKVYPKAVFFLCRSAMARAAGKEQESGLQFLSHLLKFCNDALEILRDNGRMYYLWEILDMREKLLGRMMEELVAQGSHRKADALRSMYQENRAWRQVLEAVYVKFWVPKEAFEYCYLYVMKGVFCINDVIRIRRGMLGMSRKELCEGICDVKTLQRIEGRKTSPQRAIVRELFARLGLSEEFVRTEWVTDSQEIRELMERMREYANDCQWEKAAELLERMEELADMDIPSNQQIVKRQKALFRWELGNIDTKEYYGQLKEALELTLPYEAFLKDGEKYLTHEEQSCIQNMMKGMEQGSTELGVCMKRFEEMYETFLENDLYETVAGMYEFIMGQTRSMMGNMGEYDKADQYDAVMIEGCLRLRRLIALQDNLYDWYWNEAERRKNGIPAKRELNDQEELQACLLLSRLGRLGYSEQFYLRKLYS